MSSFLDRLKGRSYAVPVRSVSGPVSPAGPGAAPTAPVVPSQPSTKDRNLPDYRYQIHQKCIYERSLPGEAYITAAIQRLQSGFFDSPIIHEDSIDDVRFVAISFVFHPSRALYNRFKSAVIRVSLYQDVEFSPKMASHKLPPTECPRFLRHAPHLMYGAVSPENLQWNFSLAGSLGVSQAPVSASLSPSTGLLASYKLYEMMRIQGSIRTLRSPYGPEYDLEDGQIVWSLEENNLQRSGLPREFTFVMLLQKPPESVLLLDVDIEPVIANWLGHYPQWWLNLPRYLPMHKHYIDLDAEIGQKFEPAPDSRGYNFADLTTSFDELVVMPGTTYSMRDTTPDDRNTSPTSTRKPTFPLTGQVGQKPGQLPGQLPGQTTGQQPSQQPGQTTGQQPTQWLPVPTELLIQQPARQSLQQPSQQSPQQTSQRSPQQTSRATSAADTLNVRVFLERPTSLYSPQRSPVTPPNQARRRSLRRSRSREGLKEYGALQDVSASKSLDTPVRNRLSYPAYRDGVDAQPNTS